MIPSTLDKQSRRSTGAEARESLGHEPGRSHFKNRIGYYILAGFLTAAARADVVLDWTELMISAIRVEDTGPTLSTRNLAILHTALYDAFNSVERQHQPYRFYLDPPENASAEATALAAANEVMHALYPSVAGRADDLYATYVVNQPATSSLSNSLAFGARLGQMTLQSRSNDGCTTDVPYIPSDAPGQWRRTPPFFRPPLDPQWRYVRLFCLPDLDPFVPPGPPPLTS